MTTPPGPPGPDPHAQGGNPQPGQPPYPPQGQQPPYPPQGQQPPYPPQGQQPGYPQQGGFPPPGGPQYGQQPASSGAPKWLIPVIGGVILVVAVVVLAALFLGSTTPEAGDCLRQASAEELEIVDCDSDDAEFRVIGIQDGQQTQEEYFADPETCAEFPETLQAFWVEDSDGQGTVYCAGAV
jgi:hypothetical protein